MIGRVTEAPIYRSWEAVPEGLRPEADLRFAGLEPRGEPVAYVEHEGRRVGLYQSADAVPRSTARRADDESSYTGSLDPSRASVPIGAPGSTRGRGSRRATAPLPTTSRLVKRPAAAAGGAADDVTAAQRWLRDLLLDDFVVLDTETTGLGYRDEVIEIGIVGARGEVVFESLVRPHAGRVPAGATRVHGLTIDDLAAAPTWAEVHEAVIAATRGRRVVAWNAPFDERMLRQSAALWGCRERIAGVECAMRAYATARGLRYGRAKLERAAAEMGVLPAGAQSHRSSDDARLTLQVLMRVAAATRGRGA